MTMLGVSPTLVRALIPKGEPTADLSSLRAITTTGEPWNAGPYDWLNEHVGGRRPHPDRQHLRRHRGRRLLPLGDADGADEARLARLPGARPGDGRLRRRTASPCAARSASSSARAPWPGMTRGIWGDDERYLETYWRRFPGVWTHGDWASIDEDGYWFLHGRSDDTLNIAGKRIGPAELESAALDHPSVAEAAAIGVPHEVKGETAWIFCALKPGAEQDPDGIKAAVAAALGKAFAPERVLFVSALPKTRSAKIVRRAVRATALGEDPGRPLDAREPRDAGRDRERRAVTKRAADELGWVDELAIEIFNEHTLAGLAVGVVRDGELVHFAGVGLADAATGRRVDADTVFRIGSISKTCTGIARAPARRGGLARARRPGQRAPARLPHRARRPGDAAGHDPPSAHAHGRDRRAAPLVATSSGRRSGWRRSSTGRCRRSPTSTRRCCGPSSSQGRSGRTRTTGSPRSASSSRT